MLIRLHKNATTTPAIRAYIQSSTKSVAELSRELGVSQGTIRRWKSRTTVEDRPHTAAHRLQTTLTAVQEAIVIELRKTLWLPLDDLLAVTRQYHPRGGFALGTASTASPNILYSRFPNASRIIGCLRLLWKPAAAPVGRFCPT